MEIKIIIADFKNNYEIKTNGKYKKGLYNSLGDYIYHCKIKDLESHGINMQDIEVIGLYINDKKIYIDGVRFEQKSWYGLYDNIIDFFDTIEELEVNNIIDTDFINTVLDEANCGYFGKIEGSDFERVIKSYKEYEEYIKVNDYITFDKYIGHRPSWVRPYDD